MKVLKWIGIVLASLVILGIIAFNVLKSQTRKHSPHDIAKYSSGNVNIEVEYYRPFKKDRVIFGELVPYGTVWRTGANDATTFKTTADIQIGGKTLKAGDYTLWTIPNPDSWEVIINSGEYGWGVDFNQQALRKPKLDVINVKVPVTPATNETEQFTIQFDDNMHMWLKWDNTVVEVPISQS